MMPTSEMQLRTLNGNFSDKALPPCGRNLRKAILLADGIAQRWSLNTQWSLWHTWDFFRGRDATLDPPTAVWDAIRPFATCVALSFGVANDLAAKYKSIPGLEQENGTQHFHGIEKFADKIQVLASWERDESSSGDAEMRPRHAVVALFLEECCVMIDLVFSPKVIVIPANATYVTMPYVTIKGHCAKRHFHYVVDTEGRKLKMSHPKGANAIRYQFHPITHQDAVKGITYHGAIRTHPNSTIPTNKVLVIKGQVQEAPSKIPSMQLTEKSWMITMCRLQVDFLNRRLTMQIPLEDWLFNNQCPQYESIQRLEIFHRMDHGVANMEVKIARDPKDGKMNEELGYLRALGSRLGLAAVDFNRIVKSVYEVWDRC